MYGIIPRLLTRKSGLCHISKYSKAIQNLSTPNLIFFKCETNGNSSIFSSICRNISKCNTSFNNTKDVNRTLTALAAAYNEQGRIYASDILNILENSTSELLKDDQDLLLLQCCGYAIPDQSAQARSLLCEKVWSNLKESGVRFTNQHYNTYLQICLENRVHVDFTKFLAEMKCEPIEETYRLLLECVCERGDIEQAVKIVALMKDRNIPADERLFNALVLGHTIKSGLTDAEKVLDTMQTAHVPVSSGTYNAIIRGLALRANRKEFMHALKTFPGVVKEMDLLQLLLALGMNGNHTWLNEIMKILGPIEISKQNMPQLDLLCVHLIHLEQPEAALAYYKMFAEPINASTDEGTYAFFLLVEMLDSGTPTKTIISTTKDLEEFGLNTLALSKITGVALKKGYTEVAWELLGALPNLRPHYFWPLLLYASRQEGETGVLNILKKMLEWGVKPDLDTMEYYCIFLCDSTDPKQLFIRLKNLGFSARDLLTAMLAFLLRSSKITFAANFCKAYDEIVIQAERLLQPLVKAWCNTGDAENTTRILQKMCNTAEVSADYTGQLLLRAFRECKTLESHEQFLELLKVMPRKRLQISTSAADSLNYWLKSPKHECTVNGDIREAIDHLVNASLNYHQTHIPHPRDMNVSELEHHLTELQNKDMGTRGALRRLIQEYSRLGNEQRVNELREQFISAGYDETPGMKASLLQTYIVNKNTDSALNVYNEIKTAHPTFLLDDFKIVDLAHLLVINKRFELAVNILTIETENRKIRGGPTLIRNCWRLLAAAADEEQIEHLFQLLVEKGYCVPSNIILGPLVKIHLNKGNLSKAVGVYEKCAENYKCTPLQLELLCALVEGENEQLLQEALNITSKIHGAETTTMSLIAALAQTGLHKSLRKFLLEIKAVPKKNLERRCERWAKEKKLFALETLAQAAYRLSSDILDRTVVYHAIMQIHSTNNDCESAIGFYRQLLEKEDTIPKKIVDELLLLVNRCKYAMPEILKSKQNG